ncbi:G-protein coupled receptor 26 [Clupea harengus]|uniref:G-protein coupled receptor 26 n=1 Tax=Clupea harengus TaxID=7950 RepID=A0A6P8EYV5_CLUHA|nr:G-protein coupled receptor 26 [Clupea harengus]
MHLLDIVLGFIIIVIAVVSFFSNLLVLLCFIYSVEIRGQVPGIFILNLSFSNIIIAIVNMPATLVGVAKNMKPFGDSFCSTITFMETFLTTNTTLSMAALSIDRWIAMVFPLSYSTKMRYKDAVIMVGYAWVHSFAFSMCALLFSWAGYNQTYASCTLHLGATENGWAKFTAFSIVFQTTSFLLPFIILCFTYLKVLTVARFHCKRIDVITVQMVLLFVDIHPSVKQRCLLEQKKRRRRATNKICIFIGSFVVCFAPYVITRLTELAPDIHIDHHWGIMSRCLAYSKGALDPFVYSLLRQQYRKALISMANRVLGRGAYPSSGHSCSADTDNDGSLRTVS